MKLHATCRRPWRCLLQGPGSGDSPLVVLAEEGVTIHPDREEYEYGKFTWIVDPEGNRIELWEAN